MPPSSAPKQPAIVSAVGLIALLLIAAAALFAVLPKTSFLTDMETTDQADAVSLAYLQALVRAAPGNTTLRMRYAEQLISLGEFDKARTQLQQFPASVGATKLAYLDFNLRARDLLKAPAEKALQQSVSTALQQLRGLPEDAISIEQWEAIAKLLLQAHQPASAANTYLHMAKKDPAQQKKWLKQTVKWYLAAEDSEKAVKVQLHLAELSGELEGIQNAIQQMIAAGLHQQAITVLDRHIQQRPDHRDFLLFAIHQAEALAKSAKAREWSAQWMKNNPHDVAVLQKLIILNLAEGLNQQAITIIDKHIQLLPNHRDFLFFAIAQVEAMSRLSMARYWARQWLKQHPEDVQVLQKLIALNLADGRPQQAFPLAQKQVELRPDDVQARIQLATIAQWTGHIEEAFKQWRWISQHQPDREASEKAIALAMAMNDYASAKTLMQHMAEHFGLNQKEHAQLATLFEKTGQPKKSEMTIHEYLKNNPDDVEKWHALARLREYNGDPEAALQAWEQIGQRFGLSEDVIINQARMLSAIDRPEEALLKMRTFIVTHGEASSKRYWQVYGDLGWMLESHDDAFHAYRWLWDHDLAQSLEARRLMILLRDEGDIAVTLRISEEAWIKLHDPEILILAMESAIQMDRWTDVQRFLAMAYAEEKLFRGFKRYNLVNARWLVFQKKWTAAQRVYRAILAIDPDDVDVKVAMLWVYTQTDNYSALLRHLQFWRAEALDNPEFWEVYAASYMQMGQAKLALPWFKKVMRTKPNDVRWTLQYAEALEKAGRASAAWRLRKYFFHMKWPQSRMSDSYLKENELDIALAIARLKARLKGMPHAENWVRPIIKPAGKDPLIREFAMHHYFDMNQTAYANFWLMRQHAARLSTPVWQQLALAMQHNNIDRIDKIIAHTTDIDAGAYMLAKSQLYNFDATIMHALNIAQDSNASSPLLKTAALRLARNTIAQVPNAAHIGSEYHALGMLHLLELATKGFYSRRNATYAAYVKKTQLYLGNGLPEIGQEYALKLQATIHQRQWDWFAYLGNNDRTGSAISPNRLLQWGGGADYRPWQGGLIGMKFDFNDLGIETPAFRVLGKRHRFAVNMTSNITNREYIAINMDWNQYHYRGGDNGSIGQGYMLGATLAHRFAQVNSLAEEKIELRTYAQLGSNTLEPNRPAYVNQFMANASLNSIIPSYFSSFGIGLSLQRDTPANDEAIGRLPIYLFDISVGWQWPGSNLAYNLTAGLGIPAFGHDLLSFRGFVGNRVAGGLGSQPLYGLGLWYEYRL